MNLRILMVDDESAVTTNFKEILEGSDFGEHNITLNCENDFDKGLDLIQKGNYDLVILDLCKGEPTEANPDKPGEDILNDLKTKCFIPVIFFTGLVTHVEHLESNFVKVIRKTSGGNEKLLDTINELITSKLILLRQKIDEFVTEKTREYFWDFLQENWNQIKDIDDDFSLGYLLIRRLANSFSKSNAIDILGDPKLSKEKVHPMEFYIYPVLDKDTFETGSILKKEDELFIIVTPSCDMVIRKGNRKAENIMLVKCNLLTETKEYEQYKANQKDPNKKENLSRLIGSRKSDRFFFLPRTPFMNDTILDFQKVSVIDTSQLGDYENIAKLDYPFAESMLSSFIRHYNRIGFPDLDEDYIISQIDKDLK